MKKSTKYAIMGVAGLALAVGRITYNYKRHHVTVTQVDVAESRKKDLFTSLENCLGHNNDLNNCRTIFYEYKTASKDYASLTAQYGKERSDWTYSLVTVLALAGASLFFIGGGLYINERFKFKSQSKGDQ